MKQQISDKTFTKLFLFTEFIEKRNIINFFFTKCIAYGKTVNLLVNITVVLLNGFKRVPKLL